MTVRQFNLTFNILMLLSVPATAHVSEQGFVLLLPTDVYNTAGAAVVALTVLALFAVPERVVRSLFRYKTVANVSLPRVQMLTSLVSCAAMWCVILLGFNGPRNPLANLMPLSFWTLGWIVLVSLAGVFGNFWRWVNPWTGLYTLIGAPQPVVRLPKLDLWPVCVLVIGFAGFLLADTAPDDPTRLALFVAIYWVVTMVGLILCGSRWLDSCELGHAIFDAYARLSALRTIGHGGFGGPGWQLLNTNSHRAFGVFALLLLAIGSFDGLNETFWWLGQIGVNPLEFPGRSAVIGPTLVGLGLSIAGLFLVFGAVVWLGLRIGQSAISFPHAFAVLAVSVLPIAFVYHIAHYFTSFLVNIQYVAAAVNDPFAQGLDLFGLAPIRVTTGFFNQIDTVRLIFLIQAGLVVFGHVWSVLMSHRIALDLFGTGRRAAIATLPLSLFMIGYTFLGLWLLAAPKGA